MIVTVIHQLFEELWDWFGHQGWEFLELGRFWLAASWELLITGNGPASQISRWPWRPCFQLSKYCP